MTFSNRLAVFAACAVALCAMAAPALAKDTEPYNAADAARKYCGGSYKRYCKNVPTGGIEFAQLPERACEAFAARLPQGCAGALTERHQAAKATNRSSSALTR